MELLPQPLEGTCLSFWSIFHEVLISNQHSTWKQAGSRGNWFSGPARVRKGLKLPLPIHPALRWSPAWPWPWLWPRGVSVWWLSQCPWQSPKVADRSSLTAAGQTCVMPSQWRWHLCGDGRGSSLRFRSSWWEVRHCCRSLVLFGAEVLGFSFKFAAEKPFSSPKELSRRVRRSPTGN